MKIVYFCNSLEAGGGIERVVISKANFLSKTDDVYIVTTRQKTKSYFFPLDRRVKHIDFSEFSNGHLVLLQKKIYTKIIDTINPDLIIAVTTLESLVLPFFDKKRAKIKEMHFSKHYRKIQNQNSSILKKLAISLLGFVEAKVYSRYDIVAPLTYEDKKEWHLNNLEVVYNFTTFQYPKSSSLKQKVVISVGRLDYQKGYDLLLKAWRYVIEKEPTWQLNIYGEGDLKSELIALSKRLNISENVHFLGSVKDIKERYLQSSIYVLSSRHEGFPLVLPEAMECGLPVVAFKAPCGPNEIIDDGIDGFLVENGNLKALADKILILIEDENKRVKMGKNAKIKAKEFEKDKIMKRWRELFDIAIKKRNNEN